MSKMWTISWLGKGKDLKLSDVSIIQPYYMIGFISFFYRRIVFVVAAKYQSLVFVKIDSAKREDFIGLIALWILKYSCNNGVKLGY